MILSHFLDANKMQTNVIPNEHTAKVKSNEKRPSKKLGFDFCISVEYKIERKFTFSSANTKYILHFKRNPSVTSRANYGNQN